VIGTALGWTNPATIALAVGLAFLFGYGFTIVPLLSEGFAFGRAMRLAFASDTISITIMEIVDNLIMLIIPGAMDAGLTELLFWGSLLVSLVLAGLAAFPIKPLVDCARTGSCSRPPDALSLIWPTPAL
jgi:hypothetical protein